MPDTTEKIITDAPPAEPTAEEIKAKELELFEQALKDRAKQLSEANKNALVEAIWYLDPVDPVNGKPIIGYLKEPNRMTKAAIADELLKSTFRGYTIALNASIMKEESDPRLWSDNQIYDAVIFAAGAAAADFVKIALSQFKKK